MSVLIGYASALGSTREVAERIASRIREDGHPCEAVPLGQVREVNRYDAVVIGSAIHNQAWLPEATRFIRDNSVALANRPSWLFGVGMPAALPRPFRKRAAAHERAKTVADFYASIHPRGDELFSGVFRSDQMPPVTRLIFRLLGGRFGDFRNWSDIDTWADGIARQLNASTETVPDGKSR